MLFHIPTIKARAWAGLMGRGSITTKCTPWSWAREGPWTAPSAALTPPSTAACHPSPWAQGKRSHVHDNANLAQATIAVWHTEIENYNSAQQPQFERCSEEIPIIHHSRVSPFLGFGKNNQTNKDDSSYMRKSSPGGVGICSTISVGKARPARFCKAAGFPISELRKQAGGGQPGSLRDPSSARARTSGTPGCAHGLVSAALDMPPHLVGRPWWYIKLSLHCPLASEAASCYHNTCFLWSVSILRTGLAPTCCVSNCDANSLSYSLQWRNRCPGVHQQIPPILKSTETRPPRQRSCVRLSISGSIWTESFC